MKKYISWLCFLITLIALRTIYCVLFHKLGGTFTPYIIGIGFSLLFNIKKRVWRYIAIALSILAVLLAQSWIALFCVGLTSLIILGIKRKLLAILLLVFLISFSVFIVKISPDYVGWGWSLGSLQNRIVFYTTTINNWNNIWLGEGFDKFKTLPRDVWKDNIRPNDSFYEGLWIHDAHSDLLQGFYELGILKMIPILFIVLLPLFFVKLNTQLNLTVFISYLCVLFQGLIDFPFHRWTTGLLSLTIILMAYYLIINEV